MILCREETSAVFLGLLNFPPTRLRFKHFSMEPRVSSLYSLLQMLHRWWTPTSQTCISPSPVSPSTLPARHGEGGRVTRGLFLFCFFSTRIKRADESIKRREEHVERNFLTDPIKSRYFFFFFFPPCALLNTKRRRGGCQFQKWAPAARRTRWRGSNLNV